MNAIKENIKKGYKQTSIGIIPEDWEVKNLEELGEVINGLTYKPDDISAGGVLVLRSSNIKERQLEFNDNVYVNTDKFNPVKKGDILICVRNGSKSLIGKTALITDQADGLAFGAFMAIFRGSYNNFLYHVFGTDLYQKEIHRNLGATINSINGSDLKLFKFPFPNSFERQKIADILSTWDEAVTKQKKLVDETKKRNEALVHQLLSGEKRVTGSKSKIKNTTLDKCAENVNLRNKNGLKTVSLYGVTKKYGLIPMREHVKGVTFSNCKVVKTNWFAYNPMRINIGSIALWSGDEDIMVSGDYVVFKCDETKLLPEYLNFLRQNIIWRNFMQTAGNGSVRIRIYFKELGKLVFPCPEVEEQKKILEILHNANNELKIQEQHFSFLKNQKKGLMQKLLTGEIRVNVNTK